jgi:hypothetical protein
LFGFTVGGNDPGRLWFFIFYFLFIFTILVHMLNRKQDHERSDTHKLPAHI